MEFTNNIYWTRAWITQELFLSRSLKLLINSLEVDPKCLKMIYHQQWVRDSKSVTSSAFRTYLPFLVGRKKFLGENRLGSKCSKSIKELLIELPPRDSQNRLDAVCSLLAISSNGPRITVNYDISLEDLLVKVLLASSSGICICFLAWIAQTIGCLDNPHSPQKNAVLLKYAFESPPVTVKASDEPIVGQCSNCSAKLDRGWKNATTMCLGAECGTTRGHIFISTEPATLGEVSTTLGNRTLKRRVFIPPDSKFVTLFLWMEDVLPMLADYCTTSLGWRTVCKGWQTPLEPRHQELISLGAVLPFSTIEYVKLLQASKNIPRSIDG